MTKYINIVFMDGDEGREVIDALYNVEGVVAHGVTDESLTETIVHLAGRDNGEQDGEDEPSWGSSDALWDHEQYTLSANLGLGYVSLTRRVE